MIFYTPLELARGLLLQANRCLRQLQQTVRRRVVGSFDDRATLGHISGWRRTFSPNPEQLLFRSLNSLLQALRREL